MRKNRAYSATTGAFSVLLVLLGAFACGVNDYDVLGYYAGIVPADSGTNQAIQLQLSSDKNYALRVELFDPVSHIHLYQGKWDLRDGTLTLFMDGAKDWRFSVDRNFILLQTLAIQYQNQPIDSLILRKLSR